MYKVENKTIKLCHPYFFLLFYPFSLLDPLIICLLFHLSVARFLDSISFSCYLLSCSFLSLPPLTPPPLPTFASCTIITPPSALIFLRLLNSPAQRCYSGAY
ncbi:hypothetical protein CHARACLAT_020296 [Characodon lateralis]|uniref:Uncharacterized protein n=1 Tax=Characodon lateralis TaxID=208331 RepID=A0ABU7CTW2_9TELE|nr:hypothetical protein [Characodon lateralis]